MSKPSSDQITGGIPEPLSPGAEGSSGPAAEPIAEPDAEPPAETGRHLAEESVLQHPPSTVDAKEILDAVDVAPPSRRSVLVTRALLGTILLTCGFAAGTWWAQHSGSIGTAAGAARGAFGSGAFPSGMPTGAGMPGSGGSAASRSTAGSGSTATGQAGSTAAGSTVAGTVKLVDGTVVYVTKADGSLVRVTTGAGTTVSSQTSAKLSDLAAGDTVTVSGSTDSDGSVAATTITERAS